MISVSSPKEMQETALRWLSSGKRISFVPTMGALHDGHLSLIREGRRLGDALVVSIFINPLQFGPKEDFNNYPRVLDNDFEKMKSCGVDVAFVPTASDMYSDGYQTYVDVAEITRGLCGTDRPGHFRGVATVVLKLFNIICPHIAIFGEKDYQQLVTIKRMVADLNMPIEIRGMPIVREPDGLAMSSRNIYLSTGERKAALSIFHSLKAAQDMVNNGERRVLKVVALAREIIEITKLPRINYVKICDAEDMKEFFPVLKAPARLLIAAFVGTTRLIDNYQLL